MKQAVQVWATSLESQYPKKMCVVLASIVLQVAEDRGLKLKAQDLTSGLQNPLPMATEAQMGSDLQPGPSKVPPVASDVSCVPVFFTDDVSTLPCTVMPKLKEPIQLYTDSGRLQDVPANSRLLRFSAASELTKGGVSEVQARVGVLKGLRFKVAFGLPWTWEAFIKKAVESEHPFLKGTGVPWGLQQAIIECKFRLDWCKRWLARARDLDHQEMQSNEGRPSHVAAVTKAKLATDKGDTRGASVR